MISLHFFLIKKDQRMMNVWGKNDIISYHELMNNQKKAASKITKILIVLPIQDVMLTQRRAQFHRSNKYHKIGF